MRILRTTLCWLMSCVCLAATYNAFAEQDSIVINANGDYVITYKSYAGWQKVVYVPSTKINPEVNWAVHHREPNLDKFGYRYSVRNGRDSRQFITVVRLSVSNVLSATPQIPDGWSGDVTLDHAAGSGFNVSWGYFRRGRPQPVGIKPGEKETGFGFDSKDLPGVGQFELSGSIYSDGSTGIVNNFPDEGPSNEENPTIIEQFRQINGHDFVARLAAVPRISVPVPYDAAVVLTGIKSHLDTDLVKLKLVDPALVTELDRWLDAAVAAAKAGNSKALRSAIQEARRLLKREYPDIEREDGEDEGDKGKKQSSRIDRLAAWVLDFDMRYVERRIQGGG
jgi:hypothetical protein